MVIANLICRSYAHSDSAPRARCPPYPRKRTLLSVIAMSAAKGGHHKLLNPHSFRGMEFNDGDEGN
jgi:hypothetical protein